MFYVLEDIGSGVVFLERGVVSKARDGSERSGEDNETSQQNPCKEGR